MIVRSPRGRPLTYPDDGQTCAVKHEMEAVGGELLIWPEIRREMSRLVILGEAARISRCAT